MTQIVATDLHGHFSGELFTAADGELYDAARAVFNAMFDRRPGLIARPRSAADVATLLAFARAKDLTVAVRGGGHSVAGYSSIAGGLLIDLAAMKAIRVDPGARRVRVQGGANWGELDRATQEHGLATTGGRVTSTGVAGFTLGSGSGWLERLHGLACDNLISAEVVTGTGRVLTASTSENADLFWGLRGGGGNFGIVTEFEFRLHPIGPMILGGLILHARDKAPEVCRFYRDFMETAPPEVSGAVVLLHAPPAPFVPPGLQGKPAVAIAAGYFGPLERGAEVLAPLKAFGAPPVDLVQPMPYLALQSMMDAGNPPGRRNYWQSENLRELPDEAIDALIACGSTATSPFSVLILQPGGGAVAAVPEGATAISGRSALWQYHCYGVWDGGDDADHIAWVRSTAQALRPWTMSGISMNFVTEVDADRVRSSFSAETYRKLVALKDQYDPTNLLRMNQNIRPSAK
jgi:FAD/FMN-containing dehydrogenase